MSATALLSAKQTITKLSEREKKELAIFLHRLRQNSPEWKKEASRKIDEMNKGKKTSAATLRAVT